MNSTSIPESSSGRPAGEDEKRIAEIEARVNAAARGPWTLDDAESWDVVVWSSEPDPRPDDPEGTELAMNIGADVVRVGSPCGTNDIANGTFIAHAREDVPYLISEVRRLESALSSATARAEHAERRYDALLDQAIPALEAIAKAPDALTASEIRENARRFARMIGNQFPYSETTEAAVVPSGGHTKPHGHVCGARGFGLGAGDRCPACEANRAARSASA